MNSSIAYEGNSVWNFTITINNLEEGEHEFSAFIMEGSSTYETDPITFNIGKEPAKDAKMPPTYQLIIFGVVLGIVITGTYRIMKWRLGWCLSEVCLVMVVYTYIAGNRWWYSCDFQHLIYLGWRANIITPGWWTHGQVNSKNIRKFDSNRIYSNGSNSRYGHWRCRTNSTRT